jgi:hypothetical protein
MRSGVRARWSAGPRGAHEPPALCASAAGVGRKCLVAATQPTPMWLGGAPTTKVHAQSRCPWARITTYNISKALHPACVWTATPGQSLSSQVARRSQPVFASWQRGWERS